MGYFDTLKNIDQQLQISREAELLFIKHLEKQGYSDIKDMTKNYSYQKAQIDIIAISPQGKQESFQVKCDQLINNSRNLFLQIVQDRYSLNYTQGWYDTSTANFLAYLDYIDKVFYVIDFQKLRRYVEPQRATLPARNGRALYDYSGNKHQSVGMLLNIDRLQHDIPSAVLQINAR